MYKFFTNRYIHVLIILVILFTLLASSLYNLTITEGKHYYEKSLKSRIRKVEIPAQRGEIRDSKGRLLAYNKLGYCIKLNSSLISSAGFSEQAVNMYDFFVDHNEKQLEFPIFIENGIYEYSYDNNIKKWLNKLGYEPNSTARQVFEDIKSYYHIDENLSDHEAMKLLNTRSVYLPISTITMQFTEQLRKEDFLKSYGLDIDSPAKEAFNYIRSLRYYRIPKEYSDNDAYKVLVYRHAIRLKGDMKYEPIIIAPSVTKETAILLAEQGHEFPGVYMDYITSRIYPEADAVSHIVGYIGRIATKHEIDKYVKTDNYNINDYVGKTGIELGMEEILHGRSGHKYIEADVVGKYVGEIDAAEYGLSSKEQIIGKDIELTIDVELQKKIKQLLINRIYDMKNGRTVESPWGVHSFRELKNVETAAIVMADPNSGKILASYSYPSYDPNVFMNGTSKEEWDALNPSNARNPIAARPLIDTTAMMSVQPGSIYKMVTAYAALEAGLNPYQQIRCDGHIDIGSRSFGCWIWNMYRGKHGPIAMPWAIKQSCNYYFFCIANGKDYYNDRPLNFEMNSDKLLEASRFFGLDNGSGAEVPERIMGVPEIGRKVLTIKSMLKNRLIEIMPEYFPDNLIDTNAKRQKIIDEIISWSEENPNRSDLINRLMSLGSSEDYYITEKLADIVKYDYFHLMDWYEGDTMNFAIGQGEHSYTPLQMARYMAIIANDGLPIELTYINKIDGKLYNKNDKITEKFDKKNHFKVIKEGLYQMVNSPPGFVYNYYKNFPIKVAGKTGSAEKEGLIPPLDEVEYLMENLSKIAPNVSPEELEIETIKIQKQRSVNMSSLEKKIKELEGVSGKEEELAEYKHRFKKALNLDRLSKGEVMREALKKLAGNITDDDINKYRQGYDNFAWFVAYAPFDKPEIAVSVMVPQGSDGYYASIIARDAIAIYYDLLDIEKDTLERFSNKQGNE